MFVCLRDCAGAEGRTDTFDVQTGFLCAQRIDKSGYSEVEILRSKI